MAERRMISKHIYDSDKFLDLPVTSQLLYTHLIIRADDDGFIGNVKRILLITKCSDVDLKLLISAGYVIPFETGVIVITDWNSFNRVPKSRYRPTQFLDEKILLKSNFSGRYMLKSWGEPSGKFNAI